MSRPIKQLYNSGLDTNVLFDDSSDEESHHVEEHDVEVKVEIPKKYNEKIPSFKERINLYLKPTEHHEFLLFSVLIIDTLLGWTFLYF